MAATKLLLLRSLRFLNSTVKSSPQGHRWIKLGKTFQYVPYSDRLGNYHPIKKKKKDLGTTNSSVAVLEKEVEDRAHFEIRKRAETVIRNIQMIKRYGNKIPGEIVERIEDEVLDLRKTMGRRGVISETKSKLDEYSSRWRNDQPFWGSRDHSGGGEQGVHGCYRGEASWDHSGSDIHTMKKILNEYGDKVPSDMAREIEGAIADLETAMEGGNADEIKARLDDANKAVSKIGEHMYGGSEFDGHEPGYKESCLNNWECHEGVASKHDPDALSGGSDAFGGSSKAGGVVERLADAFPSGSDASSGGFDDFGGGFDDFGGGFDSSGSSDW